MSSPLVFTCTWVDFSIDDFIYTDSRDTIVLRKFSSFVLFLGVNRLNGNKKNQLSTYFWVIVQALMPRVLELDM
jgi:hypothetical protein